MEEGTGSGSDCDGDNGGQWEDGGGCNGDGITALPVLRGLVGKEMQKPPPIETERGAGPAPLRCHILREAGGRTAP